MGPLAIPLIGAGAGALSQGINAITQIGQNKRNQAFAREQYNTQRQDALTDWTRQNAYNHPAEQMKRFTEAGLNKNLIYGQQNMAPAVRSSSASTVQGQAPSFDGMSLVQGFMSIMQQQQATDNLREINKNLVLRGQGLNLENINTTTKGLLLHEQWTQANQKSKINESLLDASLEGLRAKNRLITSQNTYQLDENQRRALLTAQSLKEGVLNLARIELQNAKTGAETRQIEAAIKKIQADTKLTEFDVRLNENLIGKGTQEWAKIALALLSQFIRK